MRPKGMFPCLGLGLQGRSVAADSRPEDVSAFLGFGKGNSAADNRPEDAFRAMPQNIVPDWLRVVRGKTLQSARMCLVCPPARCRPEYTGALCQLCQQQIKTGEKLVRGVYG